ncbi:MAG: dTDP-4-amino-4,6-dideoxy-D-galactose acyltransferase [Arsenophonus sp. ET-YP4-MAG3]
MFVHANIKKLNWESNFFKRKIAKLDFSPNAPIILLSQLVDYNIVQAKISTDNTKLIDRMMTMGFLLVEGEINFCLNITNIIKKYNLTINIAVERDIKELKNIAITAFLHSRFRAPWYRLIDNARFYSLWIEKTVKGTFDDVCLLVRGIQGDIYGFVTIKKLSIEKEARIGLLATVLAHQKKGIGKQLIITACQWCAQQGRKKLRIATQISNINAMRLYSKMGAQIKSTDYWLYRGQHDSI